MVASLPFDHLGDLLLNLRRKNGSSQEAIARRLGVSSKTICRWEKGEFIPSFEHAVQLARVYKVSIADFVNTES